MEGPMKGPEKGSELPERCIARPAVSPLAGGSKPAPVAGEARESAFSTRGNEQWKRPADGAGFSYVGADEELP